MPHKPVPSLFSLRTVIWAAFIALMLVTLFLVQTTPSTAQEIAASATVFDWGPFIAQLVSFLAPAILTVASALGLWILTRLSQWLGLNIDAGHRATVEQGLERAIGYALERVGDRARGGIPIDMRHTAIATAAEYAQKRIPDALAHFGVTREALVSMVEARLEGLVVDPEAEPDATQRVSRLRAGLVPG